MYHRLKGIRKYYIKENIGIEEDLSNEKDCINEAVYY
jgi:hypothetical protein